MYSSTGLSSEQITDLVARIHDLREAPASRAGRKPTLGLYKCVVVALIYLRSNRTQASIADQFHVSQKTISRTIASWMPILGQALQDCTPTVDDLDVSEPLIVDGTLLPTQGLGKVFHSSCWLGDLSGLGDELEWSQRVSRVVSEGCGDADSSGQAMEADRGVA